MSGYLLIKPPCHSVWPAVCFSQLVTRCLSQSTRTFCQHSAHGALGGALQAVKCFPLHLTAVWSISDYWSTQRAGAKLVISQGEETEGSSPLAGVREAFLSVEILGKICILGEFKLTGVDISDGHRCPSCRILKPSEGCWTDNALVNCVCVITSSSQSPLC